MNDMKRRARISAVTGLTFGLLALLGLALLGGPEAKAHGATPLLRVPEIIYVETGCTGMRWTALTVRVIAPVDRHGSRWAPQIDRTDDVRVEYLSQTPYGEGIWRTPARQIVREGAVQVPGAHYRWRAFIQSPTGRHLVTGPEAQAPRRAC